jgi:hypothetical protein
MGRRFAVLVAALVRTSPGSNPKLSRPSMVGSTELCSWGLGYVCGIPQWTTPARWDFLIRAATRP